MPLALSTTASVGQYGNTLLALLVTNYRSGADLGKRSSYGGFLVGSSGLKVLVMLDYVNPLGAARAFDYSSLGVVDDII